MEYSKNKKITFIILILIISILFFVFSYINIFKLDQFLNSDLVGEINLAKQMYVEKSLFLQKWYYPSEIYILRTPIITFFLYLFIKNWNLSHSVASIIVMFLYISSFYYMMNCIIKNKKYILIGIIMILCLGTMGGYATPTFLHGAYYGINYIFLMISIGVFFRINSKRSNSIIILKYISFIGALIFGISSIKMLQIIYIPLILISNIYIFTKEEKNIKRIKYSVILFILNIVGLVISKIYLSRHLNLGNDVSKIQVSTYTEIFNNIKKTIEEIMRSLNATGGYSLSSLKSFNMFFSLFMFIIILVIAFKMIKFQKNNFEIVTVFLISIGLSLFSMIFTCIGIDSRYLSLLIIFISIVAIITIDNIEENKIKLKELIIGSCFLLCITNFMVTYIPVINSTTGNKDYKEIAEFLEENNFDVTYATYWNSNILSGVSNGKVITGNILGDLSVFKWITSEYNYAPYLKPKKVAIILTDEEEKYLIDVKNVILKNGSKIKEMDQYNIYEYNKNPIYLINMNNMNNKESKVLDFSNNLWSLSKNVEMDFDSGTITNNENNSEFVVWGPYSDMKNGEFNFELQYEILEHNENIGFFEIMSDDGTKLISRQSLQNDNKIIINNASFCNDARVEFRVFINKGNKIKLKSVTITKK